MLRKWKFRNFNLPSVAAICLVVLVYALFESTKLAYILPSFIQRYHREPTDLATRLMEHREEAVSRLKPYLDKAGLTYPLQSGHFLYFKNEPNLHLFGSNGDGVLKYIRTFRILATSGKLGPKIKEGDRQVPEGLYKIESLNPNSAYHLSLRVNYPNQDDQKIAREEGRTEPLGGDIMIHGSAISIGCLAVGDEAIEDIFVLVGDSEDQAWKVTLAPFDFRKHSEFPLKVIQERPWMKARYELIKQQLQEFPAF